MIIKDCNEKNCPRDIVARHCGETLWRDIVARHCGFTKLFYSTNHNGSDWATNVEDSLTELLVEKIVRVMQAWNNRR